tara:strand:- start:205 stop:519 length:315 start_codon:yes stop_codon:yes gene_type:complete
MNRLNILKNRIISQYPYFFFPLIVIYLLFNIFDGNNGLLAHSRLDVEIANLSSEIENIKKNNHLYEIKISSILKFDESSDLVDEQIRSVLGYGKTNEFIIFFDN